MRKPLYLVEDLVNKLAQDEREALDRFVGAAVRGGVGDRRVRISEAIERLCAELEINLLDVIKRRLRPALIVDHHNDCRMTPSMGLRCSCGARISCELPPNGGDTP